MKRSFIAAAVALVIGTFASAPVSAKTVRECDAEYKANKAAIQPVQKKADFMAACKAGTEVIPGAGAAAAPTAAPAPTPTPAPAPATATPPATASPPAATTAPTGANQFATEAEAKRRCPAGLVVWVNTKTKIYHFPGTKNFGNTKAGAYMCETDATAEGDRASKTEKHP